MASGWSLSRNPIDWRDLIVQESVIADLQKYGFELISVREPDLMATDPTRVLLRHLLGSLAYAGAMYRRTGLLRHR